LFLRAALLLPLISLLLRLRGFRATQGLLRKFLGPTNDNPNETNYESRIALTSRMVLAAARHCPMRATCLERALCLWWLLARQGIVAQFRIGVKKEGEKFTAHAWVEYNGVGIGEPEASHLHYAAFASEMFGDAL
jgi:hypothetical protein